MKEYGEWVQPELAVVGERPRGFVPPELATEPNLMTTGANREDTVKSSIRSRREAYFRQGLETFRAGRYREACDAFLMADGVSHDDPKARALAKLAEVHADMASGQYVQAIMALRWLLTPDRRTGELPDPGFLNRLDIATLYSSGSGGTVYGVGQAHPYTRHLQMVEEAAIQNPTSVEAQALQVFAIWQNSLSAGSRSSALFRAQRIAAQPEVTEPWKSFYQVMQSAAAAAASKSTSDSLLSSSVTPASVAALLPFEPAEIE